MMRFQSPLGISVILAAFIIIAELCFFVEFFVWQNDRTMRVVSDNVTSLDDGSQDHGRTRNVILVVGVLNRLSLSRRRRAIRSTWMSDCDRLKVICKFFVDSFNLLSGDNLTRIKEESSTHGDIVEMPYTGGINFTLRLLWMMKWAMQHYNFDYFLRVDDDHFICLDRLVYELPHRPKNSLYWGFIHCRKNIVRVDEGWLLLTKDLIQEALSKFNSTLECHPFADQAVALWMIQSKYNVTYFYDNERVIHQVTAINEKKFATPDICDRYLSLHGSYPGVMAKYWLVSEQRRLQILKARHYNIPAIPRYQDKCKFSTTVFDFNNFWPEFRFNTKLCKDKPEWSNSNADYRGREARFATKKH